MLNNEIGRKLIIQKNPKQIIVIKRIKIKIKI